VAGAHLTHADWLRTVPDLVVECCEEWGLSLGEPYEAGAAGYTIRAELLDGTPAVLKLIYPHRESEHEADALRVWDGDGAVQLIDEDPARDALLLERCEPGTKLYESGPDVALDVLIGLLPRLWKPAGEPFHTLVDEAAWWRSYLPEQYERHPTFERRLLDAALDALDGLPPTQGEQVLVSQDLHAENVLAADREPWLAIDPKPLLAEREFALAPIVRALELGHSQRAVLHRLDRLSSELGLDRERARGWTIAQTLAWAYDSEWDEEHVETVRWLVEAE
jgi:streptomycin 6-kinase